MKNCRVAVPVGCGRNDLNLDAPILAECSGQRDIIARKGACLDFSAPEFPIRPHAPGFMIQPARRDRKTIADRHFRTGVSVDQAGRRATRPQGSAYLVRIFYA